MRIYTRAEWNARPPKKVMRHYPKKGFLIHHTASGHNLPQSEAADLRYQYDCQGWHIRDHDATDILQGWTVFPSGRVVEGRMPWDTDNGAIYNWGGGAVDYVGIENDGTFDGSAYMGDTQYRSLVWLCAENVRRGIVPVNFGVRGHRQVYPCRPGDPKPTGCPGNLLGQFVTNSKLKNDVIRVLSNGGEVDEVAMARNDSGLVPVEHWVSSGLSSNSQNARLYIDIVNRSNKDISVLIGIQLEKTGDFGESRRTVKKAMPKQPGMFVGEAGAMFNNPEMGNFSLEFTSDGPMVVTVTQEKTQ